MAITNLIQVQIRLQVEVSIPSVSPDGQLQTVVLEDLLSARQVIGKSFDRSAPIGPIIPAARLGKFSNENISLAVNGVIKQKATLDQMIWSVAEQIAKLSEANELFAGDIIYSGTPENVGPVVRGDVILCKLDRLPDLSIRIV